MADLEKFGQFGAADRMLARVSRFFNLKYFLTCIISDGTTDLVVNTDGSLNVKTDVNKKWGLNNIDDENDTQFYGYETADGQWRIQRHVESTGVVTYSTDTTVPGDYDTAWAARTSQTYTKYGTAV